MPNSPDDIWPLLLAVSHLRRIAQLPQQATGFLGLGKAELLRIAPDDDRAELLWAPQTGLLPGPGLTSGQRHMASLYCQVAAPPADKALVIAHLGQSLDGQIATASGDSYYVTGPENLQHLHRMRALGDAIIVGSNTVRHDNPKLTTRLVEGPSPVRVVLDPAGQLTSEHQLFTDGVAPSLRVVVDRGDESIPASVRQDPRTIAVAGESRFIDPAQLRQALTDRGHRILFVEGGGLTVSAWLKAGELDRLQLACAPVLIGTGTAGVQYPAASIMRDAMRAPCHIYQMGDDIMWDFSLRETQADQPSQPTTHSTTGVFRQLK